MKCFTLIPYEDDFEIIPGIVFNKQIEYRGQLHWAAQVFSAPEIEQVPRYIVLSNVFAALLPTVLDKEAPCKKVFNILIQDFILDTDENSKILCTINSGGIVDHMYWLVYCPVSFSYFKIKKMHGDLGTKVPGIIRMKNNTVASLIHARKKMFITRDDIEQQPFISFDQKIKY